MRGRREVWVTGVGAQTAAGPGAPALLEAIRAARTALRTVPGLDGRPAGPAPDPPRSAAARVLDRSGALFVAAAEEACRAAALDSTSLDPRRCGVVEGSSLGPIAGLLRAAREAYAPVEAKPAPVAGHAGVRPTDVVRFMLGAGGAFLAQARGWAGPTWHASAGSVSAACAIGQAFREIRRGALDLAVAGGADCPLEPEILESFAAAGVLAQARDGGVAACRPFDARRDGTLLGEGAAALVLESAEHARRRGARPLAVLAGFGFACETHSMTAPDPAGTAVRDAAAAALAEARAVAADVGWVKAHGTGTRLGDAAECAGLAALFGRALPAVPLTSLKPTLGHCLGASGAVEAAAAVLALGAGVVPATLGTERADPAFPPCLVATRPLAPRAPTALLLSESFGGRCAALFVRAHA